MRPTFDVSRSLQPIRQSSGRSRTHPEPVAQLHRTQRVPLQQMVERRNVVRPKPKTPRQAVVGLRIRPYQLPEYPGELPGTL